MFILVKRHLLFAEFYNLNVEEFWFDPSGQSSNLVAGY